MIGGKERSRRRPLIVMLIISSGIIASENIKFSSAISCYDCRSEDISCNVGECVGSTCVKMETSNIDNERKTISKSCNNEFEDNQCKQSYLGLKVVMRCTCDSNFCNGDRNLVAAGLQRVEDGGSNSAGGNAKGRRTMAPAALVAIGTFLFPLLISMPSLLFCTPIYGGVPLPQSLSF